MLLMNVTVVEFNKLDKSTICSIFFRHRDKKEFKQERTSS